MDIIIIEEYFLKLNELILSPPFKQNEIKNAWIKRAGSFFINPAGVGA